MAVRLLLTRPSQRGEALLMDCRAAGFDVVWLPLQTITKLSCREPSVTPTPHAIIAVSAHAAELAAALLPAAWRSCPLFAVGKATAQMLAEHGWPGAICPATENSEHLLDLPSLQHVAGQRIVLLRGEQGRELIYDQLHAAGAHVESLVLYRSDGPTPQHAAAIAVWAQQAGVIVISSTQALQHLCAIISPAQRSSLRLLCLGQRIADAAALQFEQVGVIGALTATAIQNAL